MKAILEEYLIDRLNESIESCRFGDAEVIQTIIDDLEEIDTLIVSKLRPMCDAPMNGQTILCVPKGGGTFSEVYYARGVWWLKGTAQYLDDSEIDGWIPMVIYKPELTGEIEQCE